MAMFGLFKKDDKPETVKQDSQATGSVVNQNKTNPIPKQQDTHTTTQTTITQNSAPISSGPKVYSGIGNPPGGQAYSGIGNPPQPKIDTKTETTTQTTASINKSPEPDKPSDAKQVQIPGKRRQEEKKDKQIQLDLMTHLTQRSNRVFLTATKKAKELKNEFIDSEHVLHGLLGDPEIYKLFTEQKVSPQTIEQELDKIYKKGKSENPPTPSPRIKRVLEKALITARKLGYEFISPEHVLLSLYSEGEGAGARVLAKLGLKKEDLNKKVIGKKEGFDKEEGKGGKRGTLEKYTTDLTVKAAQGQLDPVVERADVIERTIHILSRRRKNNPALIGEAGVGKTAIVEGLAQSIASKKVPESLLEKRVLQLDLMSILAGASHRGEFEERMKKIIEEIKAERGKIILFIDEIHNLVGAGAGGEGAMDASNFLKPSLARGELQVIGATTLTEYRKYIEKDPALERRFQPIVVHEPTVEQSIKMLKSLRDKYEAFHRVKIPNDTIESAVKLSKRYVGDRFLPDKAVDLIDEAGAAVRLPLISLPEEIRSLEESLAQLNQEVQEAEKSGNKVKASIIRPKIDDLQAKLNEKREKFNQKKSQTTSVVSIDLIKDIVSRWTGIPISKLTESEMGKLTKLEDTMHKRLINQNTPVSAVSQAVRRGRAGLKSTKRPVGSFVFLGPTGVGKTELAKTLAEVLFGQESAMIRFDMTEYMEKHEVAKLLGAPPGYVGYEEGGKLTEAVRRKPYSVILFDEIEKAHPDIFNILLQILDDGRLTDNKGRTISFKNAVVICTSNIGTKLIQEELLKGGKVDIEEPTILSTYTFSPRGRQILSIMGKVFQKESEEGIWKDQMLIDYFAGQKIETGGDKDDNKDPQFPGKEFDTQAISAKGVELISTADKLYMRTSTTSKVWSLVSLIDYFKDHVVINALPDAPEQQLPTAKLKTHAFSPDEKEIITFRDRYWMRKENTNNWETGNLKDYFEGHTVEGKDIQKTGKQEKITEEALVAEKKKDDKKQDVQNFPISYWDIHAFTPQGRELIIVADKLWFREKDEKIWKMKTLSKYFGPDFPLDRELEEKEKIESELEKNQYQKIKTKVMDELGNFFRPELINRFDEIIIFEPLKYRHMILIVDLQLKGVKKLLEEQNIGLAWTKETGKELVRQGFDPLYGARPLRRTIQKLIENPISTLIIEKKVGDGDAILVDFDNENFVFNIEKIELVPEDKLSQTGKKKFLCELCGERFETEVVKNSTPICPKCASSKVKEVIKEKTETLAVDTPHDTEPKSEETSDPEEDEEKKPQTPISNGQGYANGQVNNTANQQAQTAQPIQA